MTISEFKFWLEGYSEAIGECPTTEQWTKIKEKLNMTSGYNIATSGQSITIPSTPWVGCIPC